MTFDSNGVSEALGKDLYSTNWLYLDTNCISHLAKMCAGNQPPEIRQFVSDKNILITSSILQELRKVPKILNSLEYALLGSNLFLVPDMSVFSYSEILNLRNRISNLPLAPIEFQPIPVGFFSNLPYQLELEKVFSEAERDVHDRFFDTVNLDIGSNIDERKLCIHISSIVTKLSMEWFQIVFPPWDTIPDNFPSFFTLFYTYYFRYAKNQASPESNDFVDLQNCLPIPYCERYYGERKFTTILKNNVQGKRPPTPFRLVKLFYRQGGLNKDGMRIIKNNKTKFDRTSPLLPNVEIFNFAEMLEHINRSAS